MLPYAITSIVIGFIILWRSSPKCIWCEGLAITFIVLGFLAFLGS